MQEVLSMLMNKLIARTTGKWEEHIEQEEAWKWKDQYKGGASLMAQTVKSLPVMQEMWETGKFELKS